MYKIISFLLSIVGTAKNKLREKERSGRYRDRIEVFMLCLKDDKLYDSGK